MVLKGRAPVSPYEMDPFITPLLFSLPFFPSSRLASTRLSLWVSFKMRLSPML